MRFIQLVVVTFSVAGLFSCVYPDKHAGRFNPGFSRLRIAIDTNANFYLDTIGLSAPYKSEGSNFSTYDSTLNNSVYIFDSVKNGNVDVTLTSFLDRTFSKSILLRSDTTLFISQAELNNFQNEAPKTLPSLALNNGDTIVVGLWSRGCFHFLKENIIISRDNGQYAVAFNTTRGRSYGEGNMHLRKVYDSSFVRHIDDFTTECIRLVKPWGRSRKKGYIGEGFISTSTAFVYIRKGNQVFSLPDIVPSNWQGYNNLVKVIDPPWPKVKNGG